MNWLYLAIAVIFEITVGISAGKAEGFTNLRWTISTLVSGAIATFFLSLSLLTVRRRGRLRPVDLAGRRRDRLVGALFLGQRLTVNKLVASP
jgi:quaternary ammonium compound-resistance protein SugE